MAVTGSAHNVYEAERIFGPRGTRKDGPVPPPSDAVVPAPDAVDPGPRSATRRPIPSTRPDLPAHARSVQYDRAVTSFALRTFLTLFVVVDPVGMAPVFLGLAGVRPEEERARIARKAILVAAGVVMAFAVGGSWLIRHLGISLDAFRIAGGILLFRIAVDMVVARRERETEEEEAEARRREDISVFPLAIPLTAGPGALTTVMILSAEAEAHPAGLALVLVMAAVVLLLTYGAFRTAGLVGRVLGRTGVNVVTRILGILLAALAVQYVADGVRGLFPRLA